MWTIGRTTWTEGIPWPMRKGWAMSATEHESEVEDETVDDRRDGPVRTHSAGDDEPLFTELEGEERRAAVRSAARRLMKQNRELMDRLSER